MGSRPKKVEKENNQQKEENLKVMVEEYMKNDTDK